MWLQLFNRLRIAFAVGLLAVSVYTGWLSTYLFEPSTFRTEGSPAGAGLFVVFLLFPVVSLATGVSGLLVLFLRPSPPPPPPSRPPMPVFRSERASGADGWTLDLLANDALAVLWMHHAEREGLRSNNSQWPRDNDTLLRFRTSDGREVRLPRRWAIATAMAQRAVETFRSAGDPTRFFTGVTVPAPPRDQTMSERERWDWLRQNTL